MGDTMKIICISIQFVEQLWDGEDVDIHLSPNRIIGVNSLCMYYTLYQKKMGDEMNIVCMSTHFSEWL